MTRWNPESMEKIRWATVGYHFQWTVREYQQHKRGPFPEELSLLCSQFAKQVGYTMTPEGITIIGRYDVNE